MLGFIRLGRDMLQHAKQNGKSFENVCELLTALRPQYMNEIMKESKKHDPILHLELAHILRGLVTTDFDIPGLTEEMRARRLLRCKYQFASVQEYMEEFNETVGGLSSAIQGEIICLFIDGLDASLGRLVNRANPTTLKEAMELALQHNPPTAQCHTPHPDPQAPSIVINAAVNTTAPLVFIIKK